MKKKERLNKTRLYVDKGIPDTLLELLKSESYLSPDEFDPKWRRSNNPGNSFFSAETNRYRTLVTTNSNYLNEELYPLNNFNKIDLISIDINDKKIPYRDIGYVLSRLIYELKIARGKNIYSSKIIIKNEISIYSKMGDGNKRIYEIVKDKNEEYHFKLKSAIIDKPLNNLKIHNINVAKYDKDDAVNETILDNELQNHEKEVELSQNEFFEPEKKSVIILSKNIESSHLKTTEPESQTINIPDLIEVQPNLIQGTNLIIKKNYIDGENKSNPSRYNNRENKKYNHDEITEYSENNNFIPDVEISRAVNNTNLNSDRRISKYAKMVGDRGEEIVIKYLKQTLSDQEKKTIRWISHEGATPGWDIEYLNLNGNLIAIEVKGTTGDHFLSVEITDNEWNAAFQLKDNYYLYLVSKCITRNPIIKPIQNPYKLTEIGILMVTPIIWKIELIL